MTEKFQVGMSKEEFRALITLISFSARKYPFTEQCLWDLMRRFEEIIQKGCFKHNMLSVTVRPSINESLTFCPECEPKLILEHHDKVEKGDKYGN